MTRERVRTQQAATPTRPITAIPVTVTAVDTHTVTVQLPGGATISAPRGDGFTYTITGTGWALFQEPAVIAVFPTA